MVKGKGRRGSEQVSNDFKNWLEKTDIILYICVSHGQPHKRFGK